MAIYYIDPHTTVNGTGTWASPWSLGTATRTGLTSGDEIRIKGVELTSLLTATTYTATVTSQYQLTITAGGGLGADWAAGDIVYIPAYDTFAKIISSSANVISMYATYSMWPIQNSTVFGTSISIRKVNLASYPASGTGTSLIICTGANINNVVISDCWTSETTRVTDGTVKTLIHSTTTGATTMFLDSNSTNNYGYNISLPNTYIVMSNAPTTGGYINLNVYSSNSTITLGGFQSTYISTGGIAFGTTSAPVYNTTLTITHAACSSYLFNSFWAKDCTITVTNCYVYASDVMFANSNCFIGSKNITFNIGYIIAFTNTYNSGSLMYNGSAVGIPYITINYNGMVDIISTSGYSYLLFCASGRLIVNYDSVNFSVKYNKRVSTQTSITTNWYVSGSTTPYTVFVPTINNPTGWTVTSKYSVISTVSQVSTTRINRVPNVVYFDLPSYISYPQGVSLGTNLLVTYRDGTAPIEILSIYGNGYSVTNSQTNFPTVTRDNSVYRTAAPSLKSYLATRTSNYWVSSNANGNYKTSIATKSIKIPVTSGVSVTVTGYIRTDDAAYVNGDCDVSLYFLETEVAMQVMTTACINAWEQFTLTFTPSQTGEAYLLWDMYYANGAKSYWLDDLQIL